MQETAQPVQSYAPPFFPRQHMDLILHFVSGTSNFDCLQRASPDFIIVASRTACQPAGRHPSPAVIRIFFRIRLSMRETCTCEIPMSRAISVWVCDLK